MHTLATIQWPVWILRECHGLAMHSRVSTMPFPTPLALTELRETPQEREDTVQALALTTTEVLPITQGNKRAKRWRRHVRQQAVISLAASSDWLGLRITGRG